MILDPSHIPTREKAILTGIFLSKFGSMGLKKLDSNIRGSLQCGRLRIGLSPIIHQELQR